MPRRVAQRKQRPRNLHVGRAGGAMNRRQIIQRLQPCNIDRKKNYSANSARTPPHGVHAAGKIGRRQSRYAAAGEDSLPESAPASQVEAPRLHAPETSLPER